MGPSWRVFDDLDQVRELVARYDADHEREALRRGPFRWAIQHVDGRRVQIARVHASPQRLRGTPAAVLVHVVPQGGRVTYRVRGRLVEAHPEQAVLLAPGEPFTSWSSGEAMAALRLEGGALRREAGGLAGVEPEQLRLETALPLHTPAGRHLLSLVARRDLDRVPRGDGRVAFWEAEQIGAVARAWLETAGDDGPGGRAGDERRRVREVEEWVDAHFTRPVTLGELCRVAGLPARSLHRAFLRHRGQPPMRHVAQRRLAEARCRLLERRPEDTVTQVAFESGFAHLGRFAGLYRSAYGERPSETLSARPPRDSRPSGQKAKPIPR